MQFFKKISDLYIFSNVHVALAGFFLTKITLLKFGLDDNSTALFVGFSIIVSYNFIRYYELKYTKTGLTLWYKEWFEAHIKWLAVISGVSGLYLIYILLDRNFNKESLLLLSPFFLMTIFYAVPLIKIGGRIISLRNFPFVKIFAIAISWAAVSVLFPVHEAHSLFSSLVFVEFFQRFLILVAITIPFDIRDIVVDSKFLKTLPQVLGVRGSKKLGTVLLFIVVFLELFREDYSNSKMYLPVLVCVITGLFLWGSTSKRGRYYTSFWVESIPIIWYVLLIFEDMIINIPA